MAYYRSVGLLPRQRHTQLRDLDGGLFYEELMGEEGFSSDSSLLYHRGLPSAIEDAQPWNIEESLVTTPNQPLLPRHLKLHSLFPADGNTGVDVVTGRRLVLGNGDVRISYVVAGAVSPWYRNGVGDECVYVERGGAQVHTIFGSFDLRQGDYLIIPRSTTHRWLPLADGDEDFSEPLRAYVIEGNSHISPPRRYLSRFGQLLEHAPYCERDLRGPAGPLLAENVGEQAATHTQVLVKHRGGVHAGIVGTVYTYPYHPLDVVGWDGCLYPYAFNVADFMPITGKVHQPPPVHQVFEGTNFVVCNFVPRKVDYHEGSIPVPYYHSNVDSDEVMFYVDGDYEARKGSGIGKGSVSLHPGGHAHGPQPGAYENSVGVHYFDELAVMLDTFRPMELGEGGIEVDDGNYAWSWVGGRSDVARSGESGSCSVG